MNLSALCSSAAATKARLAIAVGKIHEIKYQIGSKRVSDLPFSERSQQCERLISMIFHYLEITKERSTQKELAENY